MLSVAKLPVRCIGIATRHSTVVKVLAFQVFTVDFFKITSILFLPYREIVIEPTEIVFIASKLELVLPISDLPKSPVL